jgi:hypothetical protein
MPPEEFNGKEPFSNYVRQVMDGTRTTAEQLLDSPTIEQSMLKP